MPCVDLVIVTAILNSITIMVIYTNIGIGTKGP